MLTIASERLVRIFALLLLALTGCAGQLFAASCDRPRVGSQAGQLTISSNGCSLQQVLTALRESGIEIELPASTSAIPVFANLGPGDPRSVVSALLDGIPFNWSLATDEDRSGILVAVVLTERIAPPVLAKPPIATTQANATPNGQQMAGQVSDGATTEASVPHDAQSDQPKRRTEIDDSTLSKLPPLPAGVPTGVWQLFPDVVQNMTANGTPAPANAQPPSTASNLTPSTSASASDPAAVPKGCQNCPVPPGVDPNIRNLYPWNLMQLINTPPTSSNVQLPPPPAWLRH